MPYMGYKGDKSAARPPEGSLVKTSCLKVPSLPLFLWQRHAPDRSPEQAPVCPTHRTCQIFVAASHQTRLDIRSKARRPIKVGIKGGGGRQRAETRTLLVYAAHRLTWCNVSLMRQAVSRRTQMWVRARMPVYGLN